VYYFQIRFSTSGQRMKPKYVALFATTVCVHALAGTPPALTPQAVKEDIWRIGAKATVQRLYAAHRWETVLEGIESGAPEWLGIVHDLAGGTDAGTSEDLQEALATALPHNPGAVLKLAGTEQFLSLDDICSAPFIEPEHAFLMRYLANARESLVRLKEQTVEDKRLKCLSQIEKELNEEERRRY
jgi:hypothetical protein